MPVLPHIELTGFYVRATPVLNGLTPLSILKMQLLRDIIMKNDNEI